MKHSRFWWPPGIWSDAPGVKLDPSARITYVHLQFARHEGIWVNVCPSESLFAVPKANQMSRAEIDARNELSENFLHGLDTVRPETLQPAQRCLTGREAAALQV